MLEQFSKPFGFSIPESVSFYHLRREVLSTALISGIQAYASVRKRLPDGSRMPVVAVQDKKHPEDFNPLHHSCFQNPFPFYRLLRDDFPVYRLQNGVYCISRYEDIVQISRDTEVFSSAHQGIVAGLRLGQDLLKEVKKLERLSVMGLIPADVLATSDQPFHTGERKVGHRCLNAHYVKSLEPEVHERCEQLMRRFITRGQVELMGEFAWLLPMSLIIDLLGLPLSDLHLIKNWCMSILNSQSGIQKPYELAVSKADALGFLRYCWRHYLRVKRQILAPQNRTISQQDREKLMVIFAEAANDPNVDFDDRKAVSAIFQLLIAGSDSSATSLGNAVKILIENPEIQAQLRADKGLIAPFIEEVFRLESAFQGHFRWTKTKTKLHGVTLPAGSRIFLLWASGNRDERFWDDPDQIKLNRQNGKKHLTFGHGIHACIGRELARLEIKVAIEMLLDRTRDWKIEGETPYIASMFARTLVKLPISFKVSESNSYE